MLLPLLKKCGQNEGKTILGATHPQRLPTSVGQSHLQHGQTPSQH